MKPGSAPELSGLRLNCNVCRLQNPLIVAAPLTGACLDSPKTDLTSGTVVGTRTQDTKLRIAVIGAGVAGITTAWELTCNGHTVTVVDKANGIAEGASFASPGWIGAAGLTGWDTVTPAWPKVGIGGLTTAATWWGKPGGLRWLAALKKHSAPDRQPALFAASLSLAALSVDRISRSIVQAGSDVERSQGIMMLMRTEADAVPFMPGLQQLKNQGIKVTEIDDAAAKKLEPGLSDDTLPAQRWWLPDDQVINGRQWLTTLKTDAMRSGCVLQMNTQVSALQPGGRLVWQVGSQPRQEQVFDAVVVCTGHDGAALLKASGLQPPLLGMSQCVLSAPIRDPHFSPVSGVFDARDRISVTRTGNRIRASSATGVWPGRDAEPVFKQLYQALNDWFPGSASLHGVQSCAQTWQSAGAFTPDGLPLLGPSGVSGIWINVGYGSKGWTLAPGAAHLIAAQIKAGETHGLSASLSPSRFD